MSVAAILLALTRGLHVAALLSLLGATLARAYLAPPALARASAADARAVERDMRRLVRVSLLLAIVGGLLWLPFLAAEMAGAANASTALAAIPDVLIYTRAGQAFAARLVLLLL